MDERKSFVAEALSGVVAYNLGTSKETIKIKSDTQTMHQTRRLEICRRMTAMTAYATYITAPGQSTGFETSRMNIDAQVEDQHQHPEPHNTTSQNLLRSTQGFHVRIKTAFVGSWSHDGHNIGAEQNQRSNQQGRQKHHTSTRQIKAEL